jgi:phage terminase large subunit-like protein
MILNVQGFTPYDKQKEWIQQIEKPSVKYITLCTGRQVGKTLLSQNLLLKWGLENNNQTIMFVSPVYSQARKVFTDIEKALAGTPLITSSNKSNYEMSFINGTKIIFRSSENSDSLRGYTLDYLICDEAAFIKERTIDQVILPTLNPSGKKC